MPKLHYFDITLVYSRYLSKSRKQAVPYFLEISEYRLHIQFKLQMVSITVNKTLKMRLLLQKNGKVWAKTL